MTRSRLAIAAGIVAVLGLGTTVSAQAHSGGMGGGMGPGGMHGRMAALQGGEGHAQGATPGHQHAQRGHAMQGPRARAGAEGGCPMAVAQAQGEHKH